MPPRKPNKREKNEGSKGTTATTNTSPEGQSRSKKITTQKKTK
jgi:hypothetical protein